MIRNFLIALCLFEAATIGLVFSLRQVFDLHTDAYWQRQYYAEHFEARACGSKHQQLVKQIKKEGLWARMGMAGQPWLQ